MYADIDECERLKPCSHHCVNTVGSFQCSCPDGMSLSGDGRLCIGCLSLTLLFHLTLHYFVIGNHPSGCTVVSGVVVVVVVVGVCNRSQMRTSKCSLYMFNFWCEYKS